MHFLKIKGLLNALSLVGVRIIVASSVFLGTALVTFGGYSIYEQMYTQNRAFESGIQAFDSTEQIEEAQKSLVEEREDYRAWLRVEGTAIDYPVMQGVNDLYYAKHDVDKNISISGAIYMSTENAADFSDNYIVIYGHHMDNGAMFGDIDRYLESGFLESHQEGVIVTPDGTYDVRFFALLRTVAYEDTVYNVGKRNLESLIAYVTENAVVKTTVKASDVTKVVALSTCTDVSTNGRLVLFGEMTLREEPDEPTPSVEPSITALVEPSPSPVISGKPNGGPDAPQTSEHSTWLGRFFNRFMPGGSSYGFNAWALVNLVCLLVTLYIVVPVNRLKGKFGRIDKMRRVNAAKAALWNAEGLTPAQLAEREEIMAVARRLHGRKAGEVTKAEFAKAVEKRYYHVDRFAYRFTIGMAVEIAVAAVAFIAFINTQNMRLPMILIDKWTPLMLLFMITCWVADLALTRYRENSAVQSENAAEKSEVRR
ncbi:MAG: class B sortase [Lachnospiraceae bacterium]|nr:class B sortase [Lachnospiraceae bacterium]